MPGRPIDELTAQGLRGYRVFWKIIREAGADGQTFGISEIHGRTNASRDSVREYMAALERGGYLEVVGEHQVGRGSQAKVYCLVRAPQDAPRLRSDGSEVVQGRAREQMWRTMHMLRQFTLRDLVVTASTAQVAIKEGDARDYVKHLLRAGYLRSDCPRPGATATYRTLPGKYTGPKPPMVQRTRQVFDPNLGKVVWSQTEGRS